jgi:hypothetical protein
MRGSAIEDSLVTVTTSGSTCVLCTVRRRLATRK